MTVVTSETRLVGSGALVLPRVNLLPPEIAEKAAFQKVQVGLGAAVAASIVIAGLLFVSASHGVSTAQHTFDASKAKNASLTAETLKYNRVQQTYAAADAAQQMLISAMGDEVRYSALMNDLSLSVPSGVWLKTLSFSQIPVVTTAPGTTPGIGTLTVSGVSFSHDDVALWLDSMTGQKSYTDAYFSNSAESLLGKRPVVNFTSTANISPAALSGRYTKPLGD